MTSTSVSKRRLLVVTTGPIDEPLLREQVQRHAGDADAEVRIVAPVAKVSPLKWLTNEEDAARAQAEDVAGQASEAVGEEAAVVDADVGDTDPVQAIEDALRTFPADELILVTPPGEEANWLEKDAPGEAIQRFGLPVTHLAAAAAG